MDKKNIVNINREIEIKREELNELILNKVEYEMILEHSMELDKLMNIYSAYLGWGYNKRIDVEKDINCGN